MPLSTGDSLGPYTVLEKLGEGGMGEVYKARDNRLGRIVALKSLPAATVADSNRRQRFLQEAQAASSLNHPNIITIHDWIEHDGAYVLVMEYVPGKTLDHLTPKRGLRLNDALKYATQVADALAAAHAHGIIHRDIKPANIMVNPDGRVKVLDFGLAKLTEHVPASEDEATLTARAVSEDGTVAGSAPYMSPEQAEGKKIDARSDIFSFGAVLYEMLTGHRAFDGDSRVSTMASILKSDPKPASQLTSELPRELDRILNRCLRKDVERRSQSIAEIKLALEEIREESESGLKPAASVPTARAKHPMFWLALLAIGIAAGALWFVVRLPASTAPRYTLRRITRDDANSSFPAVSPDGKFIVYSSDRGGQVDLWIQRTSGGDPVRLTNTPLREIRPDFSPDGSQIAYTRALPTGQEIALIPSLGGLERPITNQGFGPRFSPDGSSIAYFTGDSTMPQSNSIYVVPAVGGPSRELDKHGRRSNVIVWSPGGTHLLIAENPTMGVGTGTGNNLWYLLPVKGGPPIPVEGLEELKKAVNSPFPTPVAWLSDRNQVIFGVNLNSPGGVDHVYSVGLSTQGKLDYPPVQVTNGTGEYPSQPSADGKTIPFVSTRITQTIYALALDANRAVASGEPQRVVAAAGISAFPSITAGNSKMAYVSDRSGNNDIWVRDLATGLESIAIASPENESRGVLSPDGSKLAMQRNENGKTVSYWMNLPAGQLNKICDDCRSLLGWSPDGARIIISQGQPEYMVLHDVATGKRFPTAVHPKYPIHDVVFTPDSRWFAFKVSETPTKTSLYISPAAASDQPVQEARWIPISGPNYSGRPFWSPDGNTLYYFVSDGHAGYCLHARRLDPGTKQPRGDEFVVYHFQANLSTPNFPSIGYGLTPTRLYLPLRSFSSQVWIAEAAGAR